MTLLFVAAIAPPIAVVAAAQGTPDANPRDAATALDGRLGGTRASFERLYGPSRASGIDRAFDVTGYGLVQVQFGSTDQSGPAIVITLRSPRDPSVPATQPDDADWSIGKARLRVKRFLPADVRLGDAEAVSDGAAALPCTSEAIAEVFGELGGEHGNCRVGFIMPTARRVSFATAALTGDSAPVANGTGEGNDCAGMVAWANSTGVRLSRAQTELDAVAAIQDGAPDAADRLAGSAEAFSGLTNEQRAEPSPPAAATANYYLISGFNGYATALGTAAAAVAADDSQKAADAADGFTAAADSIARGVTELESAIERCGLSPATPAAP